MPTLCERCRFNNSSNLGFPSNTVYCTIDKNNKHHSFDDKPARLYRDGSLLWYKKGLMHRIGGPAYISKKDKIREWYVDGRPHREDGPAHISDTLLSEPFQRYVWIWHDDPVETYDEELWINKVVQYRSSWGDLQPYKTAIVLERINECFWKLLVGDEKIIVAGTKDYDEKKDEFNYD